MSRLLDLLLGTDPVHRVRMAQASLALLMLAPGVVGMSYYAWTGTARPQPVAWWLGLTLLGMVVFYALIRSGWSRRLKKELLPFSNDKGNLKFPLNAPIPYELIARVAAALSVQYSGDVHDV